MMLHITVLHLNYLMEQKKARMKANQAEQPVLKYSARSSIFTVHYLLSAFDSWIVSTDYKNNAQINCFLKTQNSGKIMKKLKDNSGGSIEYYLIDEYLYL